MGDAGIISRVLGLRAGSVFTFASATRSAKRPRPGQIDARTLIETYRIEDRRRGDQGLRCSRQPGGQIAFAGHA